MFSHFIHVVACITTSFYCWIIFHNNNIPQEYIPHILSVYPLMDICVISATWQLWIMPLWALTCSLLCTYVFSFLLCVYPGEELLGHANTVFSSLESCQTAFQSGSPVSSSQQQGMSALVSPRLPYLLPSDGGHPGRCELGSHGRSCLCFPLG